jgi:hypothetical protein
LVASGEGRLDADFLHDVHLIQGDEQQDTGGNDRPDHFQAVTAVRVPNLLFVPFVRHGGALEEHITQSDLRADERRCRDVENHVEQVVDPLADRAGRIHSRWDRWTETTSSSLRAIQQR